MNQSTPVIEIPVKDEEKPYLDKSNCNYSVVSDHVGGAIDWDMIALHGTTENVLNFQSGDRTYFKDQYINKK